MHRTAPTAALSRGLALTLTLLACSSTTLDAGPPADASPDASLDVTPDASPDASLDVTLDVRLDVSLDVTPDAPVDVRPDVGPDIAVDAEPDAPLDVGIDSPPDDVAVTSGPIDGTWRVTDIACNGVRGSDAARLYITAPNSSSFVVRGERSTYTLTTSTCVMRLASMVTYPSPGRAVFTAVAPFTCTPALCAVGCGTRPSIPYVYEYERRGAGLVMTTVGDTPDVTCTAYGQSNPITYTYEPVTSP